MTLATTFRINSPDVVQETIDGEVVIVHLKKGDYYSLVNSGADIWAGIEQGMTSDVITADLINRYDGEADAIAKAVQDLITQLQDEEIILPIAANTSPVMPTAVNSSNETKPKFEQPKLGKYTDMEELLALDPIHEVDEMGWPNAKVETLI
jgi:hypothetical protein